MAKRQMVSVSKRALVQRINRGLRREYPEEDLNGRKFAGRRLRVTRGQRAFLDLGDYYVVDVRRNFVVDTHVDLGELGRELKVLAPYERLSDDE